MLLSRLIAAGRQVLHTAQPTQKISQWVGTLNACQVTPANPVRQVDIDNLTYTEHLSGLTRLQLLELRKALRVTLPVDTQLNKSHATQADIAQAVALVQTYRLLKTNRATEDYMTSQGPLEVDHFALRVVNGEHEIQELLNALGYVKQEPTMVLENASALGNGYAHTNPHVPKMFLSRWCPNLTKSLKVSDEVVEYAKKMVRERTPMEAGTRDLLTSLEANKELSTFHACSLVRRTDALLANNYPIATEHIYYEVLHQKADVLAWLIANGQTPSHLAAKVSEEELIKLAKDIKAPIQIGANGDLMQVSTKAEPVNVPLVDKDNDYIGRPYVGTFFEVCTRKNGYEGFVVGNTKRIYDYSTIG